MSVWPANNPGERRIRSEAGQCRSPGVNTGTPTREGGSTSYRLKSRRTKFALTVRLGRSRSVKPKHRWMLYWRARPLKPQAACTSTSRGASARVVKTPPATLEFDPGHALRQRRAAHNRHRRPRLADPGRRWSREPVASCHGRQETELLSWSPVTCGGQEARADHPLSAGSTAHHTTIVVEGARPGQSPLVIVTSDPSSACEDAARLHAEWGA